MSDFWRLTASEVAGLVRARRVSATQIAEDGLARLEAVNSAINAVVEHRPDAVLASARHIDRLISDGTDPGPMAGVLVTIKDTVEQVDVPLTFGLKSRANAVSDTNGPIVDNFLRAGAVVLGTTNCAAFGYRWFTDNQLFGPTKNPRLAAVTPGGSSGGAGAAVAAGIGQVAHGGDIAGSIRYPAYACGVHGLRPSLGRVASFDGASVVKSIGSQLMAAQGPLARSVPDLDLALRTMSQEDLRDPWWMPAPFDGPTLPRRIGLCARPEGLNTDPRIVECLDIAASRLRAKGWDVVVIEDVPPLREAAILQQRLWIGDGYEDLVMEAEIEGDPGALAMLKGRRHTVASRPTDRDMSGTLKRRAVLVSAWQQFLSGFTAILMPVSGELPFANDLDLRSSEDFERVWEAQLPMIAIPFMGLPGLSLCTGDVDGIPVGIQIVSQRFREDAALMVAAELERDGHKPAATDPLA